MQPQRAVGLLRLLSRHAGSGLEASSSSCAPAALTALVGPSQRAFSSPPAANSVPPAATSVDISQEWYNRQRQLIPLGNRIPDVAVGVYLAPSATIVGDVDLLERVSRAAAAAGAVLAVSRALRASRCLQACAAERLRWFARSGDGRVCTSACACRPYG